MPLGFTEGDGNFTLGAGRIYFRRQGEAAYRYVMTTPELTLTANTEVVTLYSSDNPVAQKLREVETQRDYEGTFAAHDINPENLAIFFGGEVVEVSQTSGAVTDEVVSASAVADGVYQLGVATGFPDGKRALSSVVIDDGDGTTYVLGTDYEIDLRRGLLRILPGGGAVGEEVEANYSYGTASYTQVQGGGVQSATGAIKFVSENNEGEDIDYFMGNVTLRANGDFALKSRTDWQGLSFTISVNTDSLGRTIVSESTLETS